MGAAIMHPVPDRLKLSFVLLTSGHSDKFRAERQSVWVSKTTNDNLSLFDTGCIIAAPIWQQWRHRVKICSFN